MRPMVLSSRKLIQYVREKFVCRACEAIAQPPLLRTRLPVDMQGRSCLPLSCSPSTLHLPLKPQSDDYRHEAIGVDVSTLAN